MSHAERKRLKVETQTVVRPSVYLPTSTQCDKEGDRTTCKRCEEKGIKCEVAPKKVRHRSSDSQPSSSRSVSAGISCNENMSPPLYLPYAKF